MNRQEQLKQVIDQYLAASPEQQAKVPNEIMKQIIDEYTLVTDPNSLYNNPDNIYKSPEYIKYKQEQLNQQNVAPTGRRIRRANPSAPKTPAQPTATPQYNPAENMGVAPTTQSNVSPAYRSSSSVHVSSNPSSKTTNHSDAYKFFDQALTEREKAQEYVRNKNKNNSNRLQTAGLVADDLLVPVVDTVTGLGRTALNGGSLAYDKLTGNDTSAYRQSLNDTANTFRRDGIFRGFIHDSDKEKHNNSTLGKTARTLGNVVKGATQYAIPATVVSDISGNALEVLGNVTDNKELSNYGNLLRGSQNDGTYLNGYEDSLVYTPGLLKNVAKAGINKLAKTAAKDDLMNAVTRNINKTNNARLKFNNAVNKANNRPIVGSYAPSYMNNPMNRSTDEFAQAMGKFFDNPRLQTSKVPVKKILDAAHKGASPATLEKHLNADLWKKRFPYAF